jgi:hypothetical protein
MTQGQVARAEIVSRFMNLRLFESKFDESPIDQWKKPGRGTAGRYSSADARQ